MNVRTARDIRQLRGVFTLAVSQLKLVAFTALYMCVLYTIDYAVGRSSAIIARDYVCFRSRSSAHPSTVQPR